MHLSPTVVRQAAARDLARIARHLAGVAERLAGEGHSDGPLVDSLREWLDAVRESLAAADEPDPA